MLDKDSGKRLWWTGERAHFYFIPDNHSPGAGEVVIFTAGRAPRRVDQEALEPFSVPRAEATAWIDARMRAGFRSAGAAWTSVLERAAAQARREGVEVPEQAPPSAVDPETVLGMSPEELAGDPQRSGEALKNALRWAGARLQSRRSDGTPRGPDGARVAEGLPVLAEALKRFGEGLQEAGEHLQAEIARTSAPRTVQRVGFFKELRHAGSDGPSLREVCHTRPQAHADRILAYLKAGHLLIGSPGLTRDVLADGDAPISGTASILTDGVWAWPEDLAYYVRTHHARLPGPFLEHLIAQDFAMPEAVDVTKLVLS